MVINVIIVCFSLTISIYNIMHYADVDLISIALVMLWICWYIYIYIYI